MSLSHRLGQHEATQGRRFLLALGHQVVTFGTVRRRGDYPGTMQTPGIPDYGIWLKPTADHPLRWAWWECKAGSGRLAPAQRHFRDQCLAAGVLHVVGGVDALVAWQISLGYLRPEQVHHRHGRAATETGLAATNGLPDGSGVVRRDRG